MVAHSYGGMLHSNENESTTAMWGEMDDSLKSNGDQHMSKNILWNSIFIKSGKMNLFLETGES